MTASNKPASGGYQTDNPRFDRPLSPHLSVYRWQITMVTSILHRATGLALSVGSLLLTWWLVAIALGGEHYERVSAVISHPVGLVLLFLWSLAFFYHFANGIRHMLWDAGWGLELNRMYASGYTVFVFVVVATALTWWLAWDRIGGGA